jgi:hypothetical protein
MAKNTANRATTNATLARNIQDALEVALGTACNAALVGLSPSQAHRVATAVPLGRSTRTMGPQCALTAHLAFSPTS